MDERFRNFSFVDRITAVEPGVRARGSFKIPEGITDFPQSLAVEAAGQLAAWAAMAALDFQQRPVAGLAGKIELLDEPRPGQTLDLSATLHTCESDAVAYDGEATVAGKPLVRLTQCVGPMVPLADFDDPSLVRTRFRELCDGGTQPGIFPGVQPPSFSVTGIEPEQRIQATLQVPEQASWFGDHFPGRPVFPGTLLMHTKLRLASRLATECPLPPGAVWKVQEVTSVKLRTFVAPGDTLQLEVRVQKCTDEQLNLTMESRRDQKVVGSARVLFKSEVIS